MSTSTTLRPADRPAVEATPAEERAGRPGAARLLDLFRRRPLAAAVGIALADLAVVTIAGVAANAALPGVDQWPDFLAMCAGIAFVAAGVTALGWWRAIGFNGPARWRELGLLALPAAAFVLLPFIRGGRGHDAGTTAFYLAGYLLTGLYEEGLYRGVIGRVLRPLGATRVVLIGAALFGASHLVNVLFRNPFIVIAQALGAFTDGVGLAAVRLRTHTLWGVVALHMAHDLVLTYTRLPKIPLDVLQDTIMLAYGLYLLRGLRAAERAHGPAALAD
jgi:hypothetical protein